jgi:hypothetical protein
MRPLIQELKAKFVSDDGIWAYLDDITMEVSSEAIYCAVVNYLEARQSHYGPKINKSKSWFKSIGELRSVGAALLGSWVGGPQSPLENGGYQLVIDATEQVRRVFLPRRDEHGHLVPPLASGMTCQEQILLLRQCFHPTIGHLLRTMHPDIIEIAAEEFDSVVQRALELILAGSYTSIEVPALGENASSALHLPVRLGGAGFVSQAAIAPYASACSLTTSFTMLLKRKYIICPEIITQYQSAIQMCAFNLNCKPSDLLEGLVDEDEEGGEEQQTEEEVDTKGMQKKCCDVMNEVAWLHLWRRLSEDEKVRLMENSGKMGRAWMLAVPSSALTTLSDEEVRYGMRTVLMDEMVPMQGSSGTCGCGSFDSAMHHLACKDTSVLRTQRHTAVKEALKDAVETMTKLPVSKEVAVGHNLVADLVITTNDGKYAALDVAVVCPHGHTAPEPVEPSVTQWPSHLQVDGPTTTSSSVSPVPKEVHPSSVVRKFREGCWEGAVGFWLGSNETRKKSHYKELVQVGGTFFPFVITSGGCLGKCAVELMKEVGKWSAGGATKARELRFLYARVSVVLLKYNSRMSRAAHVSSNTSTMMAE